tara:strand:+ start:1084 stop:2079 length:996 start_codon:yes stop_codon:yes gene_type:complete
MSKPEQLDSYKEKIVQSDFPEKIRNSIKRKIIGKNDIIDKLIISILSKGHVFLEGVPGLAKTQIVKTLAESINVKFQRIQFTPDLLPADILGTLIYNQSNNNFEIKKGPIFSNIILADEINRAPAKVQSALLEVMQEEQVSIGKETYLLDEPFLVLATQNPIEQEGTYQLPEAQIDRFMFKLLIDYPNEDEEYQILNRFTTTNIEKESLSIIDKNEILEARKIVNQVHIAENIKKYIVSLVLSTRFPEKNNLKELNQLINYGASPRATIFLSIAAKAQAFLKKRSFVIPDDIREVGKSILRHRIILSYEAEAENISSDDIIDKIFSSIATP